MTHGERGLPVRRLLRRAALVAAGILGVGLAIVSVMVQTEGDYVLEDLGGDGPRRAPVLYHPSRDARFSDDLSLAVARGLQEVGLSVHRATVTSGTPRQPQGYTMIVVVANTYYWTPDRPTRRYLARARLDGTPVLGLMAGAGSPCYSSPRKQREPPYGFQTDAGGACKWAKEASDCSAGRSTC